MGLIGRKKGESVVKTVFVVNLQKYPCHKKLLELFAIQAGRYGDFEIFDIASGEPLHEIYYKIAAGGYSLLISFDCAGFELRTESDTLAYNQLGCRMAHILFHERDEYGENLSQQMNFSMFVFSSVREDVVFLQKNFPNIPNIEWLEIPEEFLPIGEDGLDGNDTWISEWLSHMMEMAEIQC